MFPEARVFGADDIRIGLSAEFVRDVDEADIFKFATNSGDANPLHVDADYAKSTAYGARLVHGAFQVALASALIGMHLPGRRVILANLSARFPAPLYFPCRVRVLGEVTAWQSETRAGQLKVTVVDLSQGIPTAEVALGFTLHEAAENLEFSPPVPSPATTGRGKPVVLVTGASGGVGSALAESLAAEYDVLGMTREHPLPERLLAVAGVQTLQCDLADLAHSRAAILLALGSRPLYGIVHAAWPGAPLGGLLQAQDEVIERQLLFGATTTVRLARLLFETAGPVGGRFVAISSVVASQKPVITLAAYSLGKGALENAVRLLAPELARRSVTINAISPGFIPTGINKHKNEQQRKIEASRVPLGRLCGSSDIAGLVAYLLSPVASFVSGQVIGLSGGQL